MHTNRRSSPGLHRLAAFSSALSCALLLSGLQSVASAAEPHDAAAADVLFRRAKDALAAGNVDGACASFAESQRLDPAAGTLLNLADCEEKQGKLATAWQHFVEGRDKLPGGRLPRGVRRRTHSHTRSAPAAPHGFAGCRGSSRGARLSRRVRARRSLARRHAAGDPGPRVITVARPATPRSASRSRSATASRPQSRSTRVACYRTLQHHVAWHRRSHPRAMAAGVSPGMSSGAWACSGSR